MAKRDRRVETSNLCPKCGKNDWTGVRYRKKNINLNPGGDVSYGWAYQFVKCVHCDLDDAVGEIILDITRDHIGDKHPPRFVIEMLDMDRVREMWPEIRKWGMERGLTTKGSLG